jgi:hypothetical protein
MPRAVKGSPALPLLSAREAGRLLLGAQGLAADPARKASRAEVLALVRELGFVQIDSINVVERAHHLTLWSRLQGYRPAHLTHLLESRRALFEQWTHDAAAIPTEWFAHWKPRFARARERIRASAWWRQQLGDDPEPVIRAVRERISREGPLRSQDFEHARPRKSAGWWDWKPQKAAMEYLWRTGELAVTRRDAFQKVFDLTERVLPLHAPLPEPSPEEHVEWACSTALARLGVATPRELAQFWSVIDPRDAQRWCDAAAQGGRAERVLVGARDGAEPIPAFALPDWRQRLRALEDIPPCTRLLSPFDPVVRDRARALRYFGFDYRFEAFTPEADRRYGYYVMPILEGDRLVGRLDPKHHRDRGVLAIRRVFWEPGVKATRARVRALEEAAERLSAALGCGAVEWE